MIGWTKFAWSGFRSLLAFAIMAATSADEAKSLAAGPAPCAGGCCANATDENSVRIVKDTYARMTVSCGRQLYICPRHSLGAPHSQSSYCPVSVELRLKPGLCMSPRTLRHATRCT